MSPAAVKRVVEVVRHVEHPMSPRADSVIGVVEDRATVPVAFGNVIVLLPDVGSVNANIVVMLSSVAPSKIRGEAPSI